MSTRHKQGVKTMKNVSELLTIQEAAEKEGVSKTTIYNWVDAGVLGYIQKGSIRLIDSEALSAASNIMTNRRNGGRLRGRKKTKKS
jgi:excisionase family DNA binding protein